MTSDTFTANPLKTASSSETAAAASSLKIQRSRRRRMLTRLGCLIGLVVLFAALYQFAFVNPKFFSYAMSIRLPRLIVLLTAGTDHTLTTTIVGGRGFTAVMVSWMAKFNPIIMVFTSLLLVVLGRGASEISSTFGLNQSFSDILTGIILFFIIGSEFFITYQVSLRKSGKKEA